MKSENATQTEMEKILESINGVSRAEISPFFYTRLQAKLERQQEIKSTQWAGVAKPVLAMVTLCILIVLNVTAIRSYLKTPKSTISKTSGIEKFAQEYDLNESAVYTDKISQQ